MLPSRQEIPRPPGARAGSPAPWASLPADRRTGIDLARVRRAVAALRPRRTPEREVPGARPAAVLVAMFEDDGEARVILTRRATTLPSHQGQVAFPGGKVDPGEELLAAALREAEEEVALDPRAVEVIGELDSLGTVATRFVLAPFVGLLERRPVLQASDGEVDEVFDVALARLLEDGVFREERWDVGGAEWPVYFFELDHDTVWGVTARILYQLLQVVTSERG